MKKILSSQGNLTDLGFIQDLPFTSPLARNFGDLRADPAFFSALLNQVGKENPKMDSCYPWTAAPQVWLVIQGKVLSSKDAEPLPLDLTAWLDAASLASYGASQQHQADFIYAGETIRQGQSVPVLASIDGIEHYLADTAVSSQGFDKGLDVLTQVAELTGGIWVQLRDYAELIEDSDSQLSYDAHVLATINALANWHASHSFDPATGAPTMVAQAGWARLARRPDGRTAELFPRTDPAVITAVTALVDGQEKLLLGSASAWEENRYSTFAGFVEAGESLENAVVREVMEECKGQVIELAYRASQPWPFPRSLMMGYTTRIANPDTVEADGQEIRSIRWFGPAELVEAEKTGQIILPGKSSISRKLIQDWLDRFLPQTKG